MSTDTKKPDEPTTDALPPWPRWRTWTIRVWYGLLSLWALSMAQGVVVLALGQAGPGERFGYATVTAWKLLATGGVIAIFWTGGRSVVGFQALVAGWLAWAASDQLWSVQPTWNSTPIASALATVVVWTLPLVLLRPDRRELGRLRAQPSAILLPLALAVAVPLTVYAVRQGQNVTDPNADEIAFVMTGLGVVLAAQAVFAALRPRATVWFPRLVALTAIWVGSAAVIWPTDLGSLGTAGGVLLLVWGLAFLAGLVLETRRAEAKGSSTR